MAHTCAHELSHALDALGRLLQRLLDLLFVRGFPHNLLTVSLGAGARGRGVALLDLLLLGLLLLHLVEIFLARLLNFACLLFGGLHFIIYN